MINPSLLSMRPNEIVARRSMPNIRRDIHNTHSTRGEPESLARNEIQTHFNI